MCHVFYVCDESAMIAEFKLNDLQVLMESVMQQLFSTLYVWVSFLLQYYVALFI